MSENFRDFLIALADDPKLFEQFNNDPKTTLREAAISNEERKVLENRDLPAIRSLLKGVDVPERVDELLVRL